jgi:hypothetical protein
MLTKVREGKAMDGCLDECQHGAYAAKTGCSLMYVQAAQLHWQSPGRIQQGVQDTLWVPTMQQPWERPAQGLCITKGNAIG